MHTESLYRERRIWPIDQERVQWARAFAGLDIDGTPMEDGSWFAIETALVIRQDLRHETGNVSYVVA